MTPLHYACEIGSIDIAKLLVDFGAHLHSEDEVRLFRKYEIIHFKYYRVNTHKRVECVCDS